MTSFSVRPDRRRETAPRLAAYTTFKLGGPCRGVVTCANRRELVQALRDLNEVGEAFTLIGGGSNLLVSDQGLDQVVIRYWSEKPLVAREGNHMVVQASSLIDDLVQFSVQEGLDGLAFCSGIPGTLGGAIAGNAGAFGEQIGDHLVSATLVDRAGNEWEVKHDDLEFAYRSSKLQRTEAYVAAARFHLKPGQRERLRAQRQEILQLRAGKHPDWKRTPTAGSFFKNIEPTSKAERRQAAGWFLEQAGAKALRVGGAHTFDKHANIIVADPGCTAAEVYALSLQMAALVKERFGLNLEREVRLLGAFSPPG
jgi:UDP-N-acetylmuramate dehydrogenase